MGLKTRIVSLSLLAVAAWIGAVIAIGMGAVRKADSAREESSPAPAAAMDASPYAPLPLCIDRSEPDEPVVALVVCR